MSPTDGPNFRSREIWPPGTLIKGDYVIQNKLGAGGFGTVYTAQHRVFRSTHVIKRLHEQYAANDEFVNKFVSEAVSIRRLKGQPNVVEVENMTQTDDGHLIIVMEHIPGGDLAGLLSTRQLSIDEVIDFSRQTATGLQAAHAANLIHRDIKPQNIMLSNDAAGKPLLKLIDFGIAADQLSQRQTSVMLGGSVGYAAPEQWQKTGKHLDGRTDLYALGATMYRMLCGRPPYEADQHSDWYLKVLDGPPVAPVLLRPDVPQALSDLVLQLLSIWPQQRPNDAAAVIARLDALREPPKPTPAPAVVPVQPPAPQAAPKPPVEKEANDRSPSPQEQLPPRAAAQRFVEKPAAQEALPIIQAPEEPAQPGNPWRKWTAGGGLAIALLAVAWFAFLPKPEKQVDPPITKTIEADPPAPKKVDIKTNPFDGLPYAYIPPGTFTMGCQPANDTCQDDEKPAHDVRISQGFWLGQTAVTVEAYKKFVRATGKSMPKAPSYDPNWTKDSNPMTMVSWDDAVAYAKWAGGRLPTEAEWEYAARAGTTGARYGELNEIAWWSGNSDGTAHPVGQKKPNGFQLYDMLGNVWQWTADWYAPYKGGELQVDPQGAPNGQSRGLRGGSWDFNQVLARVAYRYSFAPNYRSNVIGFRVVCLSPIPH